MTPLPGHTGPAVFWRLDDARFQRTWDSGEGSRRSGGRWAPKGFPVVYCSLDPATAILEVAVHKLFDTLNAVPHVLTSAELAVPWSDVHVLDLASVPNPLWLFPCANSAAQQTFGRDLLTAHAFVVFPSAVSRHSWNLLFNPEYAAGKYKLLAQEPLGLDPRFNPPGP
jgi:RES domain-containing protein